MVDLNRDGASTYDAHGWNYLAPIALPTINAPYNTGASVRIISAFAVNFLLLCIIIYRYRYLLTFSQREQVRWIIFGAAVSFGLFVSFGIMVRLLNSSLNMQTDPVFLIGLQVITALSFLIFSLTFVIAIVRHQLFDIDILINRTLVYGSLTAMVLALYMIIVIGLGTLLQGRHNLPLSLFATGVIAFVPNRYDKASSVELIASCSENAMSH